MGKSENKLITKRKQHKRKCYIKTIKLYQPFIKRPSLKIADFPDELSHLFQQKCQAESIGASFYQENLLLKVGAELAF